MRVYTLTGVASVANDDYGTFDVDPATGSVEVPHEFGELLRTHHVNGERAWENEAERQARLDALELERRRDPAALYDQLQQLVSLQKAAAEPEAEAEEPAKRGRGKAADDTAE